MMQIKQAYARLEAKYFKTEIISIIIIIQRDFFLFFTGKEYLLFSVLKILKSNYTYSIILYMTICTYHYHWKRDFPMTFPVRLSIGWSVCHNVCHPFLKRAKSFTSMLQSNHTACFGMLF